MNENDNKFNLYLEKINKAFNSDPNNNYPIIENYAKKLDCNKEDNNIKIDSKTNVTLVMFFVCFLIFMLGFLNIKGIFGYIAGSVFFFAGLFIGLYIKGFGLIFLFSHGMLGLMSMSSSLLGFDFSDSIGPMLSDGSSFSFIFIIFLIALFYILGVILTILHNLTKFRERKFAIIFPISCFGIGLLICGLFPYIFKFLN